VVIATNSRPNEDPIAPAGDAEPVKSADAAVPVTVRDPLACEVERVEALEPAVEARVEISWTMGLWMQAMSEGRLEYLKARSGCSSGHHHEPPKRRNSLHWMTQSPQ
jgi:hypothetical protein